MGGGGNGGESFVLTLVLTVAAVPVTSLVVALLVAVFVPDVGRLAV